MQQDGLKETKWETWARCKKNTWPVILINTVEVIEMSVSLQECAFHM